MTVKLHWAETGQGATVIVLHGLFGMGSNLGALARSLQAEHRVYSVDLPNHGRSDWLSGADIPAMADCIGEWMDQRGLRKASFVGHSLGGKVAMEVALQHSRRVNALVVADIAPVSYEPHHDSVFAALDAVSSAHCESRAQAAVLMAEHVSEQMVIQFLLMSLQRNAEGLYHWRFNLEEIKNSYGAIRAGLGSNRTYTGPVLFVKGGESDYILESHRDPIRNMFPQSTLKIMRGCGHWLHAEQPRLFNSIVQRFLLSPLKGHTE
ncbi:MAG: alpha/beta fold hydrolase [Halieaceae bacterium]|jgi:esterase|nr:alpha/beta fold hydrolase [Halieaceae bacterium]